jgi:hypothetical protein
MIVAIRTLAGEGEVFEKEVVSPDRHIMYGFDPSLKSVCLTPSD